ncbi:MAG: energy transducer TonB [Edaphobacter sp.]|uniref:energy transducer TonB n=1 Tax=Edaphobacter sp. TaxID=1934404 RepID=UPI0029819072|nr:energy transducer TonB [Edaphobacter sp.]MDW5267726.1 energy transducer TonB [Edaphobacter sp.]
MTLKLLVPAALLLFALPVLAQTTTPLPATTPADASTPLKIGGDVLPPVLIHMANPKFPRGLRGVGTTAVVHGGVVVDTSGKPTQIRIVKSSNAGFDKNSMDAVKKYRFKPATLHGQPVAVELVVQVNFEVFDQMPPGGYHPPAEPPIQPN